MPSASLLHAKLQAAFPQCVVAGVITPHECEECNAIRRKLEGVTWNAVPPDFIGANEDVLPLLSQQAYVVLLPAWLGYALGEPDGPVASMLLVNLGHDPQTSGFTAEQADAIVEVARFIATENYWGPDDPGNVQSLAAIAAAWRNQVA